jgi:hypothetical protein
VPSSASAGSYTITVTSTSGSLSHPVSLPLQVNAPQHAAPAIFGLPPSLFYGITGGIVAAVVASAIILLRRKSRP